MYQVSVRRKFISNHFLIGGDWGNENFPHAHPFLLELILSGDSLNQHNYLVDIVEINAMLDSAVDRYRDKLLNELPEFEDHNPSLERFSKILCDRFKGQLTAENIRRVRVVLWENEDAWAAFEQDC